MPISRPSCAVLTPSGRGAVATVAVWGPSATALVASRFASAARRPLAEFPTSSVVFGRFQAAADTYEELVVGLMAAEQIEIHCHGGAAAVKAICAALVADGCQHVEPTAWLQTTQPEPIARQAWRAITHARTQRTAAVLLDQCRGALRREWTRIDKLLAAHELAAAADALRLLVARSELGRHLVDPWKVAIVGPPNAGKSSLMNALAGYERSLVFPEPGTTRDVLTASTAINGWPIDLIDTAGLRATADPVEAAGVERARAEIAAADLALFVADCAAAWDDACLALVKRALCGDDSTAADSNRLLIVHSKLDLVGLPRGDRPAGIRISVRMGEGIDSLCQSIAEMLVPTPPPPGAPVPFCLPHIAALRQAIDCLEQADVLAARKALAELEGTDWPGA